MKQDGVDDVPDALGRGTSTTMMLMFLYPTSPPSPTCTHLRRRNQAPAGRPTWLAGHVCMCMALRQTSRRSRSMNAHTLLLQYMESNSHLLIDRKRSGGSGGRSACSRKCEGHERVLVGGHATRSSWPAALQAGLLEAARAI
jgi:hypothetical protein